MAAAAEQRTAADQPQPPCPCARLQGSGTRKRRTRQVDPSQAATMAKTLQTTGRVGLTPDLRLKPGARLLREWHGRTHTVTVTEDGFEYAGASYPSLSMIAKKITGAQWSGPRFFGLLSGGAPERWGARWLNPEKPPRRSSKRIRCAIYTRKSTDEGLEQAFNSL